MTVLDHQGLQVLKLFDTEYKDTGDNWGNSERTKLEKLQWILFKRVLNYDPMYKINIQSPY